MKIFYAVQATGNGHISRAIEILPYLKKYGDVDVFLSGNNHSLKNDLPICYRSKGMSLYYDQSGSVDLWKTFTEINLKKIWTEAKHLPIEKYDLIINDFESITSLACKIKNIPSIHFGHQASFRSKKVPRPIKKDIAGELVLRNYASGTKNIGLHFKSYDNDIYSPIIKSNILRANPQDNGYITVYLNHYSDALVIKNLSKIKGYKFEIFSKEIELPYQTENIKLLPINKDLFNHSLINCHGIITGAGFETPAEALYLGKKLMVFPLNGQYEQQCNAKALEEFDAYSVQNFDEYFPTHFYKWITGKSQIEFRLNHSTEEIISKVLETELDTYTVKNQRIKLTQLLRFGM
jgi:uncharacterized protein (TIGR00661 family)